MNIFRYENSYTKRRFELNGYERTKDFEVTVEEEVGLPEDARMFMEKGELLVDRCTDSYIPQSEFEEPREA